VDSVGDFIQHDFTQTETQRFMYPHVAALLAAREGLLKRGLSWAAAGPCGCPCLLLGPDSSRRELTDWGTILLHRGDIGDLPDLGDPAACLAWIERRAMTLGLVPCDPNTPLDPSHVHGVRRHAPRDREGWLRTLTTAWPLLPDPLILRDLTTRDRRIASTPADLVPRFDDSWPGCVPGQLPAVADVLLRLVRDLNVVPEGLSRECLNLLFSCPPGTGDCGPGAQREVIRLLSRLRRPQPPPVRLKPAETWVLRKWIKSNYEIAGVQPLRPRDFERTPDHNGFLLDGLELDHWLLLHQRGHENYR